jgi:hypothetical protein
MKWKKRGLIYSPKGDLTWASNTALQPTPHVRAGEKTIRVFAGFRDNEGVSRVGFVDVSAENPAEILRVSKVPALDVGRPGAFDENGVVPCAIIERDEKLYLYYAGYQLGQKVKFYVFSGLAISEDGGESFSRYSEVPVCDRTDGELFFRVIHSILYEEGRWRVWYGGGSEYTLSRDGKQLPNYNIRYTESRDGYQLEEDFQVCIDMKSGEYRVGRPFVIRSPDRYRMFYSAGTETEGYRLAYAESEDGIVWQRKDEEIGIDVASNGWDSEMQCYPSVVSAGERTFLFYNGNNYGKDGFGYAELEHW